MGQAELIYEVSKQLPLLAQQQLLDFAEYLRMKKGEASVRVGAKGMPGSEPRRKPHPDIAGKTRISGDIISCVPESDWNLPK